MYTTGTAFLEALHERGVRHLFANLGSDHPAIVESMEEAKAASREVPALITCPNEMVALSAAQGYAQVTGQPQAVLVHVECGTQALAGAVHNVAKARVPVLIFAGASPFTQEGELRGSRNEFIQWIQDVHDQRGIVRGYTRYDNEIRTGRNVKQLVYRAMQIACSDPKGAAYLTGAREVMEEEVPRVELDAGQWQAIAPCALPEQGLQALIADLAAARHPVVVTSFLGRSAAAVAELVKLVERLAIPVIESVPSYVNIPADHPMYLGNQWNAPRQNETLAAADLVLVIDSDVPWIPLVNRPSEDARVYYIDVDPLKEQMPLWYIPSRQVFRADAATALAQINAGLAGVALDADLVAARRERVTALHRRRDELLRAREVAGETITPAYLAACVRDFIDDDTIVCNEGISNYEAIIDHLGMRRPGSMIASGGGSLGWNGGAAIGVKLAHPDKTVVAMCGDGSYMFTVPSSVHWMARRYATPFVQIVFNNGGWKSPKLSTLAVHPDGYASRSSDLGVSFDPPADYAGIAAAAGGALALRVSRPEALRDALAQAFAAVRGGRSAVLDVQLDPL
ncbi:thiamine pyrophosphate-requiring protein [Azoarcus olearius]|uniref:Acetolactate synthase n=1 Tax=Azoarcus sp. (strain BH72) TaxID=418699 RepID=A1K8D6_AZOSB|nr:thiamine pyrophosphate-requiring protein [Azoarcus olearius]ANQ85648.1 acetolactate synthase catalytic subunit [Azoarcus olearius]CAL95091.1 acetolactate synthase [Azoarcus olearius]